VVEGGVLDAPQPLQDLQAHPLDAVGEVVGGSASVLVALVGLDVALLGGVVPVGGAVVAGVAPNLASGHAVDPFPCPSASGGAVL